jgi:competence protein ComEC
MAFFRKNLRLILLAALFFATCFIWYAVIRENQHNILTVAFLDIGQGDAIYIEAPNGNQMLIDGGPPKTALKTLRSVMPFYDRSIDMLLVTNPDADHIGGFIDILGRYKVKDLVEPGTISPSATYAELEKYAVLRKVGWIAANRGQIIWLDKKRGVGFQILFPDRNVSGLATNDGSIVGRLFYGKTSVMFTGDAPQNIERYLVSLDGKGLKSDVLKVGHHGSKTSSSEEFVGFVSPTYAAISVGADNKYGHPNQETFSTLQKFGVETFRTDKSGTIVMKSDGEVISIRD